MPIPLELLYADFGKAITYDTLRSRIQREIFIAICQAVGIENWEAIAELSNADLESTVVIPTPYLDCNEAPDLESFYGRNQELAQLEEWIIQDLRSDTKNQGFGLGIGQKKSPMPYSLCPIPDLNK